LVFGRKVTHVSHRGTDLQLPLPSLNLREEKTITERVPRTTKASSSCLTIIILPCPYGYKTLLKHMGEGHHQTHQSLVLL
jgi:hypothetical protein